MQIPADMKNDPLTTMVGVGMVVALGYALYDLVQIKMAPADPDEGDGHGGAPPRRANGNGSPPRGGSGPLIHRSPAEIPDFPVHEQEVTDEEPRTETEQQSTPQQEGMGYVHRKMGGRGPAAGTGLATWLGGRDAYHPYSVADPSGEQLNFAKRNT